MTKKRSTEDVIAWRRIWHRAIDNTPARKGWHRHEIRECMKPEYLSPNGCACDGSCLIGVWREPFTHFGKYSALCRLLGLPMKSASGWVRDGRVSSGGKHVGHLRIEAAVMRGSVPKNPEVREKLMKLAGPNGKLIAWLTLVKMGVDHRYVKPNSF